MDAKLARILEGDEGVLERLLGLADSERQTLLLAIDRDRVSHRTPAAVRRDAESDLVAPCSIPQTVLHALDGLAYGCLPAGTETLALSPVTPFGAHHTLGGNPQDNVLGTIRRVEVLGDPTVAMALEVAARRRAGVEVVRLATSHRVIRLQPRKSAGHTAHFHLFALATGSADPGSERFMLASLREHIGFYLGGLPPSLRPAGPWGTCRSA